MTQKVERFSDESPGETIRAMQAIAPLVEREERPTHLMLSAGLYKGTLHDALCVVQASCHKVRWLRTAFVRWLEHGLTDWKKELEEWSEVSDKPNHPLLRALEHSRDDRLSLETLEHFISTGYVGRDRNRLDDQYIDLIQSIMTFLERLGGEDGLIAHLRIRMARRVIWRTHCGHPEDPHRDETAAELLLQARLNMTLAEAQRLTRPR